MPNELLPCPFCGAPDPIRGEKVGALAGMYRFRVHCSNCLCYVGLFKEEHEADAAWNTRPANLVVCPTEEELINIIAEYDVYFNGGKYKQGLAKALLALMNENKICPADKERE